MDELGTLRKFGVTDGILDSLKKLIIALRETTTLGMPDIDTRTSSGTFTNWSTDSNTRVGKNRKHGERLL
jgi:hypothetical protein